VRAATLLARDADYVATEARRKFNELKGEYGKIAKCLGPSQKATSHESVKAATNANRGHANI